jgi:hypothetical protein
MCVQQAMPAERKSRGREDLRKAVTAPQKEQGRWRSMTPRGPAMSQTLKLAHAVR